MTNIESLRMGTSALHKTLENMMYSKEIMNKSLSPDQLNHLLKVNYLFFKRIESILAQKQIPSKYNLSKSYLAKRDLIVNGYYPEDIDYELTLDLSQEAFYGILYVVIGSSLGSKIISKKLEKNEYLTNSSFDFYRTASDDAAVWGEFLKDLEVKLIEQNKLVSNSVNCFKGMMDLFNLTVV
ncbi:MAG: biliverdin-producing heme oxygenase [Cyclobacteriaceae bacterium]